MVSSCHTDTMVSSCHALASGEHDSNLMTQSLDPNMLCGTLNNKTSNNSSMQDMEGNFIIKYKRWDQITITIILSLSLFRNVEPFASGYETGAGTRVSDESGLSSTLWPRANFTQDTAE